MKIAELEVRNIKGVRLVTVYAKEHVNEISGDNGAGKSSVLDSIPYALGGAKMTDDEALREGEKRGFIKLTTDAGLIVEKKFRAGKAPLLKITTADGSKAGQRQLDGLYGAFSFDPLAFSRMPPKKQIETLQQLAGPEYCGRVAELDAKIDAIETERRYVGRDIKRFGNLDPVEPADPVDVSQISEDLRAAEEYNRDQRVLRDRRESLQRQIKDADDEVRRLEDQIQVVLHKKKALFEKLEDVPIPQEPQDTEPFHQKLALAGEINERVELHKRYIAKRKELDDLGEKKEELDDALEDLRDERKQLAETAKLPVDGVQWDADGLRVNGRDFETLSASEKIRFSVRIGAASNAELKIMRVMDGSLLDKKSFEELKQIAVETDYQLWVETVGAGHGDSIEITEGVLTGGSNE